MMVVMDGIWGEATEAWVTNLRAAGILPTTIRLRRQHMRQLVRMYPDRDPWDLTTGDLVQFMAAHEWSSSARYAARSSLRSFFQWLKKAGYVEVDPSDDLPVVRRTPANPHPLGDDALAEALAKADDRQRLILHLAARCGLRRGEIARVRHRDVQRRSDGEWVLVVHGKGERERTIPIMEDIAEAIRARGEGFTFPGNDHGHLSPDWVGRMIADLLPEGWTIHAARHRFATRVYAEENDLFAVQRLLGHATPTTTQIYVQVSDDRLRRAMRAAS